MSHYQQKPHTCIIRPYEFYRQRNFGDYVKPPSRHLVCNLQSRSLSDYEESVEKLISWRLGISQGLH